MKVLHVNEVQSVSGGCPGDLVGFPVCIPIAGVAILAGLYEKSPWLVAFGLLVAASYGFYHYYPDHNHDNEHDHENDAGQVAV